MEIYIYGTGSGAENLFHNKINTQIIVKGFLDSDSKKWGNKVDFAPQYQIIGIEDMIEPYDFIVIASVCEEIYSFLLANGIPANKIIILNELIFHHAQNQIIENRYTNMNQILKPEYIKEHPFIKNIAIQGSYCSPIVDLNYIHENESKIFKQDLEEESGIELNMEKQMHLLHCFSEAGDIVNFTDNQQENLRFYGNNGMFHTQSAHILSHIISTFQTKRIIEVGSGFSSAAMLDVNENVMNNELELMFIEPNPERLKSILKPNDHINLLECKLQDISLDVFQKLNSGDILFIDSSHISKTGSDVNYVLFEILPSLKEGVIIHFHDIFFPFEYSKEWVYEGRGWTEDYLLRAFLQYNKVFQILFWEDSIKKYAALGKVKLQKNDDSKLLSGASLYLRKEN